MKEKLTTLKEAVALIEDGNSLAIATSATAIVREIIRQGKKNLTVYGSGIEADMLIGAGCVSDLHTFSFAGENIRRAALAGSLKVREHSEMTYLFGALAGGLGLPFAPFRSWANDHVKLHPEWRTFPSPFDGKPLLAVAAIVPDVTLIHVPEADKFGNGRLGDTVKYNVGAIVMATRLVEAGKKVIVSAEQIIPEEEIRKNPEKTSFAYCEVDAVVHVPHGAHPLGLYGCYAADNAHTAEYLKASANPESFRGYLATYVFQPADHNAYLKVVGML